MLESNDSAPHPSPPHVLYRGMPWFKGFLAIRDRSPILIKQLMSQPVVTCQVSDHLGQAARLMWEWDCGAVPILDENGRAIAMLTDRDICMAAYMQGKPLSEINVRTAMSKGLWACSPEASLGQVEQLMREHQLRRIPVLNAEGQPVGMVSLNDLALAATKQHPGVRDARNAVSLASTAETLAALSAHRLESAGPKRA